MRTNQTYAHAAIADAASFCFCSKPTAAPQRRSPNRTFGKANMARTETAHSRQLGQTHESQTFQVLAYAISLTQHTFARAADQ